RMFPGRSETSSLTPIRVDVREFQQEDTRQNEAQRILIYLLGSAVILAFLLVIAHEMNPPDSALSNQSISSNFGPWEGSWQGTEIVYSLEGSRLSESQSRWEFWSSSPHIQSATFTRLEEGKPVSEEVWVNKSKIDGTLTSSLSRERFPIAPFNGTLSG